MRVLWIIPQMMGKINIALYNNIEKYTSGHWIDATAEKLILNPNIELFILTENHEDISKYYHGINYIGINLKSKDKFNSEKLKRQINELDPDIVQIWGTESNLSLHASRIVKSKYHSVVVIQGMINSIKKYKNGRLTLKELYLNQAIDFLKFPFFNRINKSYEKISENEVEILNNVQHVISESNWAFSYCKVINPDINLYYFPLQIRKEFYEHEWLISNIIPHSIFTITGRGAHKGLHQVLKAASILKNDYPDIKVFFPGKDKPHKTFKSYFLRTPYESYLIQLIKKFHLQDNVEYLGKLNEEEIISYLKSSNVFVMPSVIENQSSFLREAQIVGVPSIASDVGCVSETVKDEVTGLLYRYEEFEHLAYNIDRIFKDNSFAEKISENSREFMNDFSNKYNEKDLTDIYKKIMNKESFK